MDTEDEEATRSYSRQGQGVCGLQQRQGRDLRGIGVEARWRGVRDPVRPEAARTFRSGSLSLHLGADISLNPGVFDYCLLLW